MQRCAFSLVELSIVLVILGLLTGGILAGQSLIHGAELRAITTERNKNSASVASFRDKYFAVPGDMANATKFWGAIDSNPFACIFGTGTGTQTCDGNGTGLVGDAGSMNEPGQYWQQLANAGLIEGSYQGINTDYITYAPHSKSSRQAIWAPYYRGLTATTTYIFGGDYGHVMYLNTGSGLGLAYSPPDVWNIDSKVDDGLPGTGSVMSYKGTAAAPCTSVANTMVDAGATYNLSASGIFCTFIFKGL